MKNELKDNIKKIQDLKKENYKLKQTNNNLTTEAHALYHNNYSEFLKMNNKIIENKDKIKLNNVKIAILKNNLHFLFKMFYEAIKTDAIKQFEKKKIGEKTKEKIIDNIKDYFKSAFDVTVGGYITIDTGYNNTYYKMDITLYLLNADGYKDFTLEYNEAFKIHFATENEETILTYFNNINEYVELAELNKKACALLRDYKKTVKKIEILKNQQKEIYHNFKDYLQAFVYNELEIETTLRIY